MPRCCASEVARVDFPAPIMPAMPIKRFSMVPAMMVKIEKKRQKARPRETALYTLGVEIESILKKGLLHYNCLRFLCGFDIRRLEWVRN